MEIDSTKPPALWLDGSTGRPSRPIRIDTVGAGHVLTLDCLHTFAIDISTLADNWGERVVECPLEHVVIQDRGKYGEALPVRVVAPRVFDDEERLRREIKAEPFRGTVRPEWFPVPARSSVGSGPGNPGPWEWRGDFGIGAGPELLLFDGNDQWIGPEISNEPGWSPIVRDLIAAAPEMADALRKTADLVHWLTPFAFAYAAKHPGSNMPTKVAVDDACRTAMALLARIDAAAAR